MQSARHYLEINNNIILDNKSILYNVFVQVKVTVLEDNNPMDEYRYLLSVGTGHRRGASTSSQVALKPFLPSAPSVGFHVSYEIWLTGFSVYTDVQKLCGYLCA